MTAATATERLAKEITTQTSSLECPAHFFYNAKGDMHLDAHDYRDALIEYSQAIYLYPSKEPVGLATLHNKRGDLYFVLGENELAVRDYSRAIDLIDIVDEASKPHLLAALSGRFFCFFKCHEEEGAYEDFTRIVSFIEPCWQSMRHLFPDIDAKSSDDFGIYFIETPVAASKSDLHSCMTYAMAAVWACSRVPDPLIRNVCYGCTEGLRQACTHQAHKGKCSEKCLEPLADLFLNPLQPLACSTRD